MATQLAEQTNAGEGDTVLTDHDEGQTPPRDFETEARSHGWTPKDDFKGDPSRWVDAEAFVKRADEVMPLLKKKTENQDRQIAELRKEIRRLGKAEQSAYSNAVADLKAQQKAAVEIGDVAAFDKADKQLEKLREEVSGEQSHSEDPAEEYDNFREANAWYDRANLAAATEIEVEARLFADRLADKYARQGKQSEMAPSEFFALIAKETEAKFPLLKVKPQRQKPLSPVAGVTNGGGSKGKTGANLPADAKETAERYMRLGIFKGVKTKEEAWNKFAQDYTGSWS